MAFFRVPCVLSVILAALAVAGMRAIPDCQANVRELRQTKLVASRPITVRWPSDPTIDARVAVEVTGLALSTLRQLRSAKWELSRWQRLLSVYAREDASAAQSATPDASLAKALPSVLGTYKVESGVLRFEPRYPLEPRIVYYAVL